MKKSYRDQDEIVLRFTPHFTKVLSALAKLDRYPSIEWLIRELLFLYVESMTQAVDGGPSKVEKYLKRRTKGAITYHDLVVFLHDRYKGPRGTTVYKKKYLKPNR